MGSIGLNWNWFSYGLNRAQSATPRGCLEAPPEPLLAIPLLPSRLTAVCQPLVLLCCRPETLSPCSLFPACHSLHSLSGVAPAAYPGADGGSPRPPSSNRCCCDLWRLRWEALLLPLAVWRRPGMDSNHRRPSGPRTWPRVPQGSPQAPPLFARFLLRPHLHPPFKASSTPPPSGRRTELTVKHPPRVGAPASDGEAAAMHLLPPPY